MCPEITIDWENIQCEMCGMCCPSKCQWKKNNLCQIHPSITGDIDIPGKRGIKCHLTPLQLFEYGGFCPPVIRALLSTKPDLKIIRKRERNGQIFMKNYLEVLAVYKRMRSEQN